MSLSIARLPWDRDLSPNGALDPYCGSIPRCRPLPGIAALRKLRTATEASYLPMVVGLRTLKRTGSRGSWYRVRHSNRLSPEGRQTGNYAVVVAESPSRYNQVASV